MRGPWRAVLEDGTEEAFSWPWRRTDVRGVARLQRGFQRPPNLQGCRVTLAIDGPAPLSIRLNDTSLDAPGPAEINGLLQPRNQLVLEVRGAAPEEVRLEIWEDA